MHTDSVLNALMARADDLLLSLPLRRERLASLCLSGLLANPEVYHQAELSATGLARRAVECADALIAELGTPKPLLRQVEPIVVIKRRAFVKV